MGYHTKATLSAELQHDSRDEPLAPTEGWAGTCGLDASLCDYMVCKHFIKPTASVQLNRSIFGTLSCRLVRDLTEFDAPFSQISFLNCR
eukprot:COSAG05_NODE_100_length_19386_cov_396.467154_21_plen_89_part_00